VVKLNRNGWSNCFNERGGCFCTNILRYNSRNPGMTAFTTHFYFDCLYYYQKLKSKKQNIFIYLDKICYKKDKFFKKLI